MRNNTAKLRLSPSAEMNTDIVSERIDLRHASGFSVQATWAGTPVGVLKLQASNDPADDATWTDVDGSEIATEDADGAAMWNYRDAFFAFYRVAYVRTSGTSTLTLYQCTKGV
jgi:hypothetical protein